MSPAFRISPCMEASPCLLLRCGPAHVQPERPAPGTHIKLALLCQALGAALHAAQVCEVQLPDLHAPLAVLGAHDLLCHSVRSRQVPGCQQHPGAGSRQLADCLCAYASAAACDCKRLALQLMPLEDLLCRHADHEPASVPTEHAATLGEGLLSLLLHLYTASPLLCCESQKPVAVPCISWARSTGKPANEGCACKDFAAAVGQPAWADQRGDICLCLTPQQHPSRLQLHPVQHEEDVCAGL